MRRNAKPICNVFGIYIIMSKDDLQKLNRVSEITLGVKGRKSGKDTLRHVWFAYEDNTVYLLPVQGSDTNWYKNMLAGSKLIFL
jgi:hypothetical protein